METGQGDREQHVNQAGSSRQVYHCHRGQGWGVGRTLGTKGQNTSSMLVTPQPQSFPGHSVPVTTEQIYSPAQGCGTSQALLEVGAP
jgi:hypothetical protein